MSMADGEDVVLGTSDESKALNAKGPTVGPSTSKQKRTKQNADELAKWFPGETVATTNAHESSLHTPESYPDELAKRQGNAIKRAKKAEKERAREEENRRLLKDDVDKKKAESKSEGHSKRKQDPSSTASKRKSAPKKRTVEPPDELPISNSSDDDDPPLTKEEVVVALSEQVNITTSTVLPDLWVPMVPEAPTKKITTRKTPPTTITIK